MKYEELIILLPCHSLEDFPQHHEGDDADSLLASWTALWHPALLSAAQSTPAWYRSDSPPQTLANRLLVVPTVSMRDLPTGYAQRAKQEGACIIRKETKRETILEQALGSLDGGAGSTDPELALDFLALGYGYLQIQLLTRQMRYSSNLDEAHFRQAVVGAAQAAVAGEHAVARDKLAACFYLLAEERDHYYSVDVFLLDLNLLARTTIGESLRNELLSGIPTSTLLTAEVLEELAEAEPQSLNHLRNEVDAQRVSLVGGDFSETQTTLLSGETILDDFQRGLTIFQKYLGRRPELYGRRRFGLTPAMPLLLRNLGYRGGLHFTLDDGRCPVCPQTKSRWEGADGTIIDVVGKPPLDASKSETFLGFASKLGGTMDSDHVASLMLAHWPGQTSPWYADLKRVVHYCSALGKFTTLDQYFRDTIMPSHQDRFSADQYQSPFLRQAVIRKEPNPISTSREYWRKRVSDLSDQGLSTMLMALFSIDDRSVSSFARALPRKAGSPTAGCLFVNPLSFSRRVFLGSKELSKVAPEKPIVAAEEFQKEQHVVIEIPPMGFAWVGSGGTPLPKPKKAPPPMAESGIVRNEFFEAVINPTTGTLQSIHLYNARGNRLSQQLAIRLPDTDRGRTGDTWQDPDENANYSVMACDRMTVTSASTVRGEIITEGRLMNKQGKTLAKFKQHYSTMRGSRVLRLKVEIESTYELQADPWNSYVACRFAWADESASLWRAVNEIRQPAEGKRFESPLYVEMESGDVRTTILTGGLPYHRRTGPRMLDTLLMVRGETSNTFELGMMIDSPQPMQEALGLLAPESSIVETALAPSPANSGWVFHIDAKNVVVTFAEPMIDEGGEGRKVVGIRLRLREVAGRTVSTRLSAFRDFSSARQVDFRGETINECSIEKGAVQFQVMAHEWMQVEARWS